jgi:hypothetical protein
MLLCAFSKIGMMDGRILIEILIPSRYMIGSKSRRRKFSIAIVSWHRVWARFQKPVCLMEGF